MKKFANLPIAKKGFLQMSASSLNDSSNSPYQTHFLKG